MSWNNALGTGIARGHCFYSWVDFQHGRDCNRLLVNSMDSQIKPMQDNLQTCHRAYQRCFWVCGACVIVLVFPDWCMVQKKNTAWTACRRWVRISSLYYLGTWNAFIRCVSSRLNCWKPIHDVAKNHLIFWACPEWHLGNCVRRSEAVKLVVNFNTNASIGKNDNLKSS